MTPRTIKKQLEELKAKANNHDKNWLHNKRIKYLYYSMDDTKDEFKLIRGLTDEERVIVAIETFPEYNQYKEAIESLDTPKAIGILDQVPSKIRIEIINQHYLSLQLYRWISGIAVDRDYCVLFEDFREQFKESREYKLVQDVKKHFNCI